jgi:hypothetical protein
MELRPAPPKGSRCSRPVPVSSAPTHGRLVASGLALGLPVLLACAVLSSEGTAAGVVAKEPPQPRHGPGGSHHAHRGIRVSAGGAGADAWYAFEPTRPKPKKAPLAIVMHGYGEYTGYGSMKAFIRHTVRRGSVVVYPRWQTGVATPCPGPFDIEPCIASANNGIKGALDYLRHGPGRRVKPGLSRTSYFGFSFGGIVTANMANRWRSLGLPKPRAIFLDDPHDGALTGPDEPALDDDLGGIPSSTLFQCHAPADGVIGGTDHLGQSTKNGSCNAVFPKLSSIPARNRDLVLTHTDDHGIPTLAAIHGVCAAGAVPGDGDFGAVNAYDWNFCWKVWDALRSCALKQKRCRYALGNTRKHRSMGKWSDGVPVTPLKVRNKAPIRP